MEGTMRGIALAAATAGAALLLAAAQPASAYNSDVSGDLGVTGAVTITWHGDPARGCAAAGLCGYSGSLTVRPDSGEYDFTVAGGRLREGYVFLDVYSPRAIVRVKRTEGGSEAGGCVDVVSGAGFDMYPTRAGRRRVRLALASEGLSSGRCAGPPLNGLLKMLPRRTRSLASLTDHRALLDFSGDAPFSKSRFSGTIRSTLRMRFGKGRVTPPDTGGGRPRDRRPRVRIADLHAVYRVARYAGSLSTSFGSLSDPPCADFDACGLSGSTRWSIDSAKARVSIDALARTRRSDHGASGVLAAVRRGPANVYGEGNLTSNFGTVRADMTRSGGSGCHDTASAASPGVALYTEPSKRLTFELDGEDAYPSPDSLVRTGCPGPRDEDVLGLDPTAFGTVPIGALGKRVITVRMRDSRPFSKAGFDGHYSADLTLRLERVSLDARYRRARGID
jgi:hypothetical protein